MKENKTIEKREYEVSYEVKILHTGLFSVKEISTDGIEIVSASSYTEVQEIMDKKMKDIVAQSGEGVALLPSIKSIKKL
jgi:AICAR transformylase/IMP cyclohydrolase PurH